MSMLFEKRTWLVDDEYFCSRGREPPAPELYVAP